MPRQVGIVAVIGGDDDEIVRRRICARKRGEPGVELDERLRVASDIAAVAEEHVEIDEVGEEQAVVAVGPAFVDRGHAFGVGSGRRANAVMPLPAKMSRFCRRLRRRSPLSAMAFSTVRGGTIEYRAGRWCAGMRRASPVKGRAMTRPMRQASQWRRAMRQIS